MLCLYVKITKKIFRGVDAPRPPYRGLVYKPSVPPNIEFTIRLYWFHQVHLLASDNALISLISYKLKQ